MNFRTEIKIVQSNDIISHSRQGFMAGSCFAENICHKLNSAKFKVTTNPTGILFNPLSISDMLRRLSADTPFTKDDLQNDGDMWFSWQHHGSFSGQHPETVLKNINDAACAGVKALADADYVILTFGTAWVYKLAGTGQTVANCHKQPDSLFIRERLDANDIVADYSELLSGVLKNKKVIFTISPVRHLKDGFEGNSLSKAILRLAVEELTANHSNAFYFPSYEIMNDDLRDYRFYNSDMVHPTPQAVDYIWDRFTEWAMSAETRSLLPRIEAVRRAAEHRPLNPNSDANIIFRAKMADTVKTLSRELPDIDFTHELSVFK